MYFSFVFGSLHLELRGFPGVAGSLRDAEGRISFGCGQMECVTPLGMVRLPSLDPIRIDIPF